jgi:hypothetical protein
VPYNDSWQSKRCRVVNSDPRRERNFATIVR